MIEAPASFEGPAFTPTVKALATVMMGVLAVNAWQALPLMIARPGTTPTVLLMLALLAVLLLCYVWMLISRTRVTETHIRQTWIKDKEIALADITQIKLIHVPRLSWLIASRLIVRTRMPGSRVFYTADPQVLGVFRQLVNGRPPTH